MPKIEIVDNSKIIKALIKRYGEYYFRSEEAIKELQKLWGVDCNPHGVVQNCQRETIVKVGSCEGEFVYAETKKKLWLMSTSVTTAISGQSSMPSVFDHIGYKHPNDARIAAMYEILSFFENTIKDNSSTNSEKNKANAGKCIDLLKKKLNPQLKLF